MKLDPRIENENLIYTPFSDNEANLKGKGYFANVMGAFTDLSRCEHGTLDKYNLDKEYPYHRKDGINYAFFIPESNLLGFKKKKPKYVPFETLNDLRDYKIHIGDVIQLRPLDAPDIQHSTIVTNIYFECNSGEIILITLGADTYSLDTLCNNYLIKLDNKWVPFGKKV